jgi:hypothetical protein
MDPALQSDLNTFLVLVRDHNWVAIAAIVDGLLIRLAKSDRFVQFFPVAIAPKWRPWFALGIGVVEGCIAIKVFSHGVWSEAIFGGISAGVTAITGHELVVESIRNGRDLFVPKLPPAPPGSVPPPPKAISIKPPASTITFLVITLLLQGCYRDPEAVVAMINSGECREKGLAAKGDAGTCEEKRARIEKVLQTDPDCVALYGDATPEVVCRVKREGGSDGN